MAEVICGYEYDSDDYEDSFAATCELPKGHSGQHQTTFGWDTRPADVCQTEGHVWSDWYSYVPPARQDISDVLLISLLPGLTGHLETIKAATRERVCSRCERHENDGESHWVGAAPMPVFEGMDLGTALDGSKLVWREDKLNG